MGSLFDDDENLDAVADEFFAEEAETPTADAEALTPRSTSDLFGHEDIENRILADFNAGRMPHAIVLCGPSGIGKATLAYRLARFLFAQGGDAGQDSLFGAPTQPENIYIAPSHDAFRRVASGGHADLLVIERAFDEKKGKLKKNITAEDARGIAPFLRKTAVEGGWRVVLVDGAEDLNPTSQNALLKILEEPPPRTVLILTTTQPGALLPTIRSRCRMLPMLPLGDETVKKLLLREHPKLMPDEVSTLLRVANGSIGKALQFYRDDGITIYKSLLTIVGSLPQLDLVAVHEIAEKMGRQTDEDVFLTVRDIMVGWCDRVVAATARKQPVADLMPGDSMIFSRLCTAYPSGHFMSAGEKISQLFDLTLRFNLDKRQAILGSFLMLQQPDYQALVA